MVVLVDVCEWSFLDPILTARFEDEGISEFWAGLSFMASSFPYVIACYFLHHFEAKFGYKACLQIGIVGIGVACSMMGPLPLLFAPHAIWITILAMGMSGIFQAFSVIPMVAEVMRIHSKFPDKEALNDYSCALFSTFYGIGDIFGPLIGNFLFIRIGFAGTCCTIASICLVLGVLYITLA
jgi:MFS family permease